MLFIFTLHPLDLAVEFLFWFSFANLLSKIKSLFFSLWTKICQILHVIFESTRQFSFKFCINIQSHQTTRLYFFSSKIICFYQKKPIKVQIFEVFECLDQNSSNSLCQFWNDKSIPLQFLHPFLLSWHITPLKFEGYPFSILDKRTLSKTQFWDFQVLWWKFAKFLRPFLETQISVSSNFLSIISDIKHQTPLYFLSWSTLYFWPQAAH